MPQQRQRVGVARGLGRLAQHDAHEPRALAGRRAHQHVARRPACGRSSHRRSTARARRGGCGSATTRWRAPVSRRARGMSTVAARKSLASTRRASRARSSAVEWLPGIVEADRVREARALEPHARAPSRSCARTNASTEPARAHRERLRGVVGALEQQRPQQVGDRHALAGRRLMRDSAGARRRSGTARTRRASGSSSSATSAVISLVAEAIARRSRARAAVEDVPVAGVDDHRRRRARRAAATALRRPRRRARRGRAPRPAPATIARPSQAPAAWLTHSALPAPPWSPVAPVAPVRPLAPGRAQPHPLAGDEPLRVERRG